jgi:hypothetical protein
MHWRNWSNEEKKSKRYQKPFQIVKSVIITQTKVLTDGEDQGEKV